jgi:pimeloyl-ACP methyl ester carboxylesterase
MVPTAQPASANAAGNAPLQVASKGIEWREARSSSAVIEEVRLHWAELGPAAGDPLVLLHGLNDSHQTWQHVAPALARRRRVLMPDLAGHGLSSRPDATYALAWHAHVIAAWFARLGLENADVVGHSYGGGVAQMLLIECAARIRRLVLAASGGLGRELGLPLRLAALPHVVELLGQPFMALGTRLALRGSGYTKQDIAQAVAMTAAPGSARAFARTVRDIADWRGQRRSYHQRAHEVPAVPPIAIFWGDRDKMIPISHGRAFVESGEGLSFKVFTKCGHYLHHDNPELFVQLLIEFLDAPIRDLSQKEQDRMTDDGAPPRF